MGICLASKASKREASKAWPLEGATKPASEASVEGEAPSGFAGGGGAQAPIIGVTTWVGLQPRLR